MSTGIRPDFLPVLFKRYQEELAKLNNASLPEEKRREHAANAEKLKQLLGANRDPLKTAERSVSASPPSSAHSGPQTRSQAATVTTPADSAASRQERLRALKIETTALTNQLAQIANLTRPEDLTTKLDVEERLRRSEIEKFKLEKEIQELDKTAETRGRALPQATAALFGRPYVPYATTSNLSLPYNSQHKMLLKNHLIRFLKEETLEEPLLLQANQAHNKVIIDLDVEQLLDDLVKEFLDDVLDFSASLARHRIAKSGGNGPNEVTVGDISLNLERNWGIVVDGNPDVGNSGNNGSAINNVEQMRRARKRGYAPTEGYISKLRKVYEK